ncbi:MAG: type II secretion system protein GspM [Gemmatimonadota bacterium]
MVAGGGVVSLLSLLIAFVLIPQARRWSDREAEIRLKSEQLARLQGMLAQAESVQQSVADLDHLRRSADRRLLGGATAAVASSSLQLLLNRYTTESGMELQRVDAAGQTAGPGPLQRVPARVTVQGDIRGLVDLLVLLHQAETLIAVDEMRVSASPGYAQAPDLITASVGLHGYYRVPESDR